jgi:hypothetical protein
MVYMDATRSPPTSEPAKRQVFHRFLGDVVVGFEPIGAYRRVPAKSVE